MISSQRYTALFYPFYLLGTSTAQTLTPQDCFSLLSPLEKKIRLLMYPLYTPHNMFPPLPMTPQNYHFRITPIFDLPQTHPNYSILKDPPISLMPPKNPTPHPPPTAFLVSTPCDLNHALPQPLGGQLWI